MDTAKKRRFLYRAGLLLSVLVAWCPAKASCIPPPPAPPVAVTATFDDTRELTPEETTKAKKKITLELTYLGVQEAEVLRLRSLLPLIRQHLDADDLTLFNSVSIGVVNADDIAACSYLDQAGVKHISITTGLYHYLDLLVEIEVESRASRKPQCANAYAAYLTNFAIYNAVQTANQVPPYLFDLPTYFTKDHLDICPDIELAAVGYTTKGELRSQQYQQSMFFSFLFVVLHEFGHIKNGDIYRRPDQSSKGILLGRLQEAAADQFALDFFVTARIPPILSLPIFYLIASVQNFPVEDNPTDVHPLTLARFRMVAQESSKIRARHFRAWLRKQPPDMVHDSAQFHDYMNRLQQLFPPIH